MIDFLLAYRPLLDIFLLAGGYALSQWVAFRAGLFSVATAGFASIGAYGAALLTMNLGWPYLVSLPAGAALGAAMGLLLSIPLARLRGVYQAIATLAFVQIVVAVALFSEDLTGGAVGLNGIPRRIGTWELALALIAVFFMMHAISLSRVGRAFDAIRQDEVVARSLGISVTNHHTLAFALSGGIAGLFGGLEAFRSYTLLPSHFGFEFVVAALSYVVLGGRRSALGPIVGAAILLTLPEIARPLADYRMAVYGAILMLVMAFMPRGVVDTLRQFVWRRRLAAEQN
jgi:branched-chain amino acid transport system permease protein